MKISKILITIFIALSLASCTQGPSQGIDTDKKIESVATVEETVEAPEFTYKEFVLLPQYAGELTTAQLEFCEKLSYAVENGEESVDASMLADEKEIYEAYYAYVVSNPLYALVRWNSPSEDMQTFNIAYENNTETHKELIAKWHELIENIVSSSISNSETVTMKNLYDYITVNSRYEYTAVDPLAPDYTNTTAYLVLTENKGICETYSRALNYLLAQVGIESRIITSGDVQHAWVMAKIDGIWYQFDPTFENSSMYPEGFVTDGQQVENVEPSYNYFGMSDEIRGISWNGDFYYCTKQDWDSRQIPEPCNQQLQIN